MAEQHISGDFRRLPFPGERVVFTGATDAQAKFGRGADPRLHLREGAVYLVDAVEMHSWHTLLFLAEYPDVGFNSSCFDLAASGTPESDR